MAMDDRIERLLKFQATGIGFDALWVELEPLVTSLAAASLGKRRRSGQVVNVVADDIANRVGLALSRLAEPQRCNARFDPTKTRQPGLTGLRAWLSRIVANAVVDAVQPRRRRRKRGPGTRHPSPPELVGGAAWVTILATVEAGGDDPTRLTMAELEPIVAECLRRIPVARQRRVVALKLHDGLSLRQTATLLGVPVCRVMGDLDAGMTTLRRLLVERGVEPGDATPRRRSARRPRAFDRRPETTPGAMPAGAPRRRGSGWGTGKSWEVIDGKRS
ncbi:MAG: RNA polymerase sigma factor [Planctomycetaceae bacterium]